jgi:hypothetical protein
VLIKMSSDNILINIDLPTLVPIISPPMSPGTPKSPNMYPVDDKFVSILMSPISIPVPSSGQGPQTRQSPQIISQPLAYIESLDQYSIPERQKSRTAIPSIEMYPLDPKDPLPQLLNTDRDRSAFELGYQQGILHLIEVLNLVPENIDQLNRTLHMYTHNYMSHVPRKSKR